MLVNGPAFAAPTPAKFLANLKMLAATTDKAEGAKKVLSAVARGTETVIEAFGGKSAMVTTMGGQPETNILGETFYSQTPFLYGDYVAKFSVVPGVRPFEADRRRDRQQAASPNALREAVAAHFAAHGGEWDFGVPSFARTLRPCRSRMPRWPGPRMQVLTSQWRGWRSGRKTRGVRKASQRSTKALRSIPGTAWQPTGPWAGSIGRGIRRTPAPFRSEASITAARSTSRSQPPELAELGCRCAVDSSPVIPACLESDLVQIGVAGEGCHSCWADFVPGDAECVDDGVVAVEQPVAEVSLPQEQPDAFDRVQLRAIGWQQDQRHAGWHGEVVGDVPSGLVHDHGGMLARSEGGGEAVQEQLHGGRVEFRQHQGERLASLRLHRGEQVCPGVALVAQAGGALAADEPLMAGAALLAEPRFVLEPERQAAAWMRRCDAVEFVLQPLFDQASRAAGSALGCDGRAFCRDRPSLRISLDMCAAW